jgi:hypothetical protein
MKDLKQAWQVLNESMSENGRLLELLSDAGFDRKNIKYKGDRFIVYMREFPGGKLIVKPFGYSENHLKDAKVMVHANDELIYDENFSNLNDLKSIMQNLVKQLSDPSGSKEYDPEDVKSSPKVHALTEAVKILKSMMEQLNG